MAIYDDVLAAQQLIDECFNPETGEILEEEEAQAIALKKEILEEGIEKLCKVRANYIAEAEMLKNEEKRLSSKRKSIENKTEWLEKHIEEIYFLGGCEKIKAGTFTVSSRKSEVVSLVDGFVNESYGSYTFSPDKKAIKQAIKNGETIEGAKIIVCDNLQIK